MEKYFGISYQFDKRLVREQIDKLTSTGSKGYVCVADGVTMSMFQSDLPLKNVLDHASVVVCDSGWVPVYLRLMYGIQKDQYSGTELMADLIQVRKYKMMFLGSSSEVLDALKENLIKVDHRISGMVFESLPFKKVENFDYPAIADLINHENPDIVWVSLGMPKQEFFMYNLHPFLMRGVLIGVGAAFKFHSGLSGYKRAPGWMVRCKLEWLYRIWSEPGKQLTRCLLIVRTVPVAIIREYRSKK